MMMNKRSPQVAPNVNVKGLYEGSRGMLSTGSPESTGIPGSDTDTSTGGSSDGGILAQDVLLGETPETQDAAWINTYYTRRLKKLISEKKFAASEAKAIRPPKGACPAEIPRSTRKPARIVNCRLEVGCGNKDSEPIGCPILVGAPMAGPKNHASICQSDDKPARIARKPARIVNRRAAPSNMNRNLDGSRESEVPPAMPLPRWCAPKPKDDCTEKAPVLVHEWFVPTTDSPTPLEAFSLISPPRLSNDATFVTGATFRL